MTLKTTNHGFLTYDLEDLTPETVVSDHIGFGKMAPSTLFWRRRLQNQLPPPPAYASDCSELYVPLFFNDSNTVHQCSQDYIQQGSPCNVFVQITL